MNVVMNTYMRLKMNATSKSMLWWSSETGNRNYGAIEIIRANQMELNDEQFKKYSE